MKRVLFLIIALFGLYSCSTFTEELDNVFEVSSPRLIESPVGGGTYEVEVNALCSYKLSCRAGWVILGKKEVNDAGTNKVSIKVEANGLATARETKLLISNEYYGLSEYITIKQAAAEAYINVSENNLTASVAGETVQFKVSANVTYTLSSDASWCKLSDTKGSVSEDRIYYLNVESNPNLENRTANITISNSDYNLTKTITLVQNGAYSISYTSTTDKHIEPDLSMAGVSIIEHRKTLNSNGEIDGLIIVDKPITTIVDGMFSRCSSLTSITIPNSVTSIGDQAFILCSGLKSVTIPNSVISIGSQAFSDCYYLTSVTIPDSVTSIGNDAFSLCQSLTSITIPGSITSIEAMTFYCCNSLENVTILNGVTSIGNRAFDGCYSLTSVTIPDSVTSIEEDAFYNCNKLTDIYVNITNLEAYATGNITYATPLSVRHLLVDGIEITNLVIPNGVTSIGYGAFGCCSSLTSITIPDSVTSIGDLAFYGCSNLTSVTIPDSVPSIGYGAFAYCINLTSVKIPDNVTSIGEYAFYACSSLTSVTIPNSVTSIGEYAFYACSSLTSVTIPDSVTSIGDAVFAYCSSLTSITIPDGVTSIGNYAFYGCSSLTSVYCKATTPPTLGGNVFYGNASGRKFYVDVAVVEAYKAAASWSTYKSDIVTVYGEEYKLRYTSFNGKIVEPAYTNNFNASIVSNTYENGEGVIIFDAPLTSIGYRAFYFCNTLTSVTIPETVTSIVSAAFNGCTSLSKVYCKATTPPQGGYNMFYNTSENLKIYVPTNSVSAYKTPQFWSDYSSKIVGYDF